jgi:hypothetical protein
MRHPDLALPLVEAWISASGSSSTSGWKVIDSAPSVHELRGVGPRVGDHQVAVEEAVGRRRSDATTGWPRVMFGT